ncbi:16S rRNA (cytosine(1407)-C(5))-methyltransferase RsmF [Aliiglaciecola sp. CAU 1673]|uniref:16S rRNA (cytosine(1407)-C(5))-methyltransferase RsmF n=1 Tax=Aliiglaciecola sp. CAU 1673 TaxID=3032595 RepID=UPI0023D9A4F0|nr:16S rRNA (cytosine(1407)-C(5))-methyltransferase RsmF [Aliiglaciecola sp. CAU 1673]MDF2177541.1 16S rRNA (cytosine(1407)-C(5))-methyltransferase RsmF [Aliiglaciecola sp. CAU 1673]
MEFPEALLNHLQKVMPASLDMEDFVNFCQRPLRKSIRVNSLKISVQAFVQKVQPLGWQLTPIPWCEEGFWLERPKEQEQRLPLGNTAEHMTGLFYIQEASSMLPPIALLQGKTAQWVLDMAAAPGSKSTQLSAMMQNQGLLVANELSSSRIKSMVANFQRVGVMNTAISHFDGQVFGQWLPECFDAVLLDAPCGGEGVVRKDPNALKNWSEQAVEDACALQKKLIESAFNALKPGGTLVYSTCTLNTLENQDVCRHLLETYPDAAETESLAGLFEGAEKALTPEGYLHVWPQLYDSEGFFVARFRKTQSLVLPEPAKRKAQFPYIAAGNKEKRTLEEYLRAQFGYTLPDDALIYIRDNDYWWFPATFERVKDRFRFERIGLKLATLHKKTFRLSHDAAMALGASFTGQQVSLDVSGLVSFFQGRDIEMDKALPQGEVLVTYEGTPVGLGKGIGAKLKNALPRELVRDDALITW